MCKLVANHLSIILKIRSKTRKSLPEQSNRFGRTDISLSMQWPVENGEGVRCKPKFAVAVADMLKVERAYIGARP